MNYLSIRGKLNTGDVFLVKSESLTGKFIRIFTAESVSHVALILTNLDSEGVWVAEMSGGRGVFRMVPASQWMEEHRKDKVSWGLSPIEVRQNPETVRTAALEFRGRFYSYWTLITTWISQIIKTEMPYRAVCSTFVQDVWEEAGYSHFEKTADPGDIVDHCVSAVRIENG